MNFKLDLLVVVVYLRCCCRVSALKEGCIGPTPWVMCLGIIRCHMSSLYESLGHGARGSLKLEQITWAMGNCRGSGVAGVTGVHWRASLTGVH